MTIYSASTFRCLLFHFVTESKEIKIEDCGDVDFDLNVQSAIVDDILEKRLPQMVSEVSKSENGYGHELIQLEQQVNEAAVSLMLLFLPFVHKIWMFSIL